MVLDSLYKQCAYILLKIIVKLLASDVSFSNCTTGEIRLVDGTTIYEGRVEVCMNGIWGAVCDSGWSDFEAYAVCHQLGYQGETT